MDAFLHDLSWVLPLRSEWATHVANAFTFAGYAPFFFIILPIGYWLWDKAMFTRLALLVILTGVTNGFLKDLFNDPRPPIAFALDQRVGGSYGMPSGHAQVAAAMWLWIAWELKKAWVWPIALLLVAGVSLSRLYLGVHDVEDILSGLALGVASLFLFRWFLSGAFAPWRALSPLIQIGVILLGQAAIYFIWPEEGGPGVNFAVGGLLLGWWGGVLYETRYVHYARHRNLLVALGAAALGLAVIFLGIMRIAGLLAPMGLGVTAAQWIQAAILGFFVTAIAPRAFQLLRLAGRAR